MAWLNRFRRLAIRYEGRADIHEVFDLFGCALICLNQIRRLCQVFWVGKLHHCRTTRSPACPNVELHYLRDATMKVATRSGSAEI